jgi:hypothetical protein
VVSFPQGFPTKILCATFLSPYMLHAPPIPFFSFDHPNNIRWTAQAVHQSTNPLVAQLTNNIVPYVLNPTVHKRVHKSLPLKPVLTHFNTAQSATLYFRVLQVDLAVGFHS